MPADASGVTTDDQGRRPGEGGDDPAPAQPDSGRPESSSTVPGDAAPTGNDAGPGASTWGNGGTSTSPPDPGPLSTQSEAPTQPNQARSDATEAPAGGPPDPGPIGLAGGEPPPAPVLVPQGRSGRFGRVRGRHASARADRASRRGLRVNQRLWSIDPWSVFKVSVLFYFCLGLIILVAGTLLYNGGRRVGTIDQVESFVTRMGAYGECVAQADVPEGTEFEADDDKCADGEVLVGGFVLDDGTLFRAAAIGGTILVVAGSIGNVLLTVLLNLLNELTGGLRHTVIKEPVARPAGSGSARSPGRRARPPAAPDRSPAGPGRPPGDAPRVPGGPGRPPSGSLRPRPQR